MQLFTLISASIQPIHIAPYYFRITQEIRLMWLEDNLKANKGSSIQSYNQFRATKQQANCEQVFSVPTKIEYQDTQNHFCQPKIQMRYKSFCKHYASPH